MIYTFDVFDTLITRTTLEPIGIFGLMQSRICNSEEFCDIPAHTKKMFALFRIDAEKKARKLFRAKGIGDITIKDIYEQLAYMCGLSEKNANKLMELEFETEYENSVPIKKYIHLFKNLKKDNSVYILSDMYLPEEFIRRLLVKADSVFADVPILVSGEIGLTKSTGRLYRYFLDKYKVDVNSWIHLGDNPVSDGARVEMYGGRAQWIEADNRRDLCQAIMERIGSSTDNQIALGTVKNTLEIELSETAQIGVYAGGPILHGYVQWVLKEAVRNDIKSLYFMARDGYVLKQIADIIIARENLNIETFYFYGSRYALRIPSICLDVEKTREWLNERIYFSNVAELADKLQITIESLREYIPAFFNEEEKLTTEDIQFLQGYMFDGDDFCEYLCKLYLEKRKNVIGYLKQELRKANGKFAFVEVNGTGYTQQCLKNLIHDEYTGELLTFFYSMTENKLDRRKDCIFYTYLHANLPMGDMVEVFTRAPHGQTISYMYEEQTKQYVPILCESNQELPDEKLYQEYTKGVLLYVENVCHTAWTYSDDLVDSSYAFAQEVCQTDDEGLRKFIGDMPFSVSGLTKDTVFYGPKMNRQQLYEMYILGKPYEECVKGCRKEFSLLRLGKEEQKLAQEYSNIGEKLPKRPEKKSEKYYTRLTGDLVLYGAGVRGKRLYDEFLSKEKANVVLWVDSKCKESVDTNKLVSYPEAIKDTNYDYVLIAVRDEGQAKEIETYVKTLGVPKAKIIWSGAN